MPRAILTDPEKRELTNHGYRWPTGGGYYWPKDVRLLASPTSKAHRVSLNLSIHGKWFAQSFCGNVPTKPLDKAILTFEPVTCRSCGGPITASTLRQIAESTLK